MLYVDGKRTKNQGFGIDHNCGCILYLQKCFYESGSIPISILGGEYLSKMKIYQSHPRPMNQYLCRVGW